MSGSGENGAIKLVGARVGSQLVLSRAEVTNNAGIALTGDGLQVDTDFYVINSCLSGTGLNAPVHLSGTRVGGQLWFQKTTISNTAEVKVIFNNAPVSPVHVDSTAINLRNATVGGPVIISIKELACPSPTRGGVTCPHSTKVELNGFTFGALDQVHWWEWLHLIRCHTWSYRPQPYQQLAMTEREAGHDGNARQILIAQQQDLYHRAPEAFGNWWVRKFHWLWGVLAGYGYRVRRIALALLVAPTTASCIGVVAGHIGTTHDHYAAERIASFSQQTGQPCSTVELIGVGLDRGLPLAPTGVRARCDINTTTGWGQILTIAIWIVQAGIWSLATLALAGYTSLVRRPT